jgi:hypothetical protein
VRIHLGERVSQRVDLLTVMFVGKQVGLDDVTWWASEQRDFTKGVRFFEVP